MRAAARARELFQPLLAAFFGLGLGLVVTSIAGESPLRVARVLAMSAFGSRYDFGMTLFYATPLVFTGLSVALSLQAGLFNIGAEGQLTVGALAAAAVGAVLPQISWPLAPLLALVAAFAAGALWGALPGGLRAWRGSHEVISTIMLNFVASGLAGYVTLYLLRNPDTQYPETRAIGAGYRLAHLGFAGEAPVSTALFVALAVAGLVAFFLRRTILGYELRAVGESEPAARAGGIDPAWIRFLALTLSGGLAGLVAAPEVLGSAGRFRLGFSPDYGFIGIAVALLGRGKPLGIVAAALLFGALHKGAADLDLETASITRDVSLLLQALVILAVSAEGFWAWMWRRPVGRGETTA